MKAKSRISRIVSIFSVLMMTASGLATFPLTGGEQRAGAVDASAIGFPSHKDIDDPNPSKLPYPPTNTTVMATVKNTGSSAIASQFPVTMEVGKGTPQTRFYEDAEGTGIPSGWSVMDFTGAKWHLTNKSFMSPDKSAWCGIEDEAAIQYGSNWAESMTLNISVQVPSAATPYLQFSHFFSTKFNTDGGYVEIRNMSVSPERWDRNVSGNWSFTTLGYNGTTASINPAQTNDTFCFCGQSIGWQQASINLAHYAGYNIRVRFVFSSSSNAGGQQYGWFIDDVKISDSITTPFQDAFDSMANWTAVNMKGSGNIAPGWGNKANPRPGFTNATSTKCFSNNNPANGAYSDAEDSALATPSISLAGSTNARLYFWHIMLSQAFNDGGFIEVQRAGGEWVPLQSPWLTSWGGGTLDTKSPYGGRNAFSNNPNVWTRAVFDLSQYNGSSIRIRFHFFANDDGNTGFGWYLDEITVVSWDFTISGSAQRNAPPLNPTQTANLNFTFDLSGDGGIYSFKLITGLPGDQDGSNDAFTIIIDVSKNLSLSLSFAQNPETIVHGRTENITVKVSNTGNMPNDITLRVVSSPPSWGITLNRTNITALKELATANTTMRVTVPLNESVGPFNITVTATSKLNTTQTMESTLTVQVVNGLPTARQKPPQPARVFEMVFFDGSTSTDPDKEPPNYPDGDPLNYSWDLGDGSVVLYWPKVSHAYDKAGKYTVKLNVSDGGPGSYDTNVTQVDITDGTPIPVIRIVTKPNNGTFQISTPQISSPVEFNGSDSGDEQTSSLTYEWDFGDGSDVETGMTVFHNFTSRGTFNVTLEVTDKGGQSNISAPKAVVINDYPVARISSPLPDALYYVNEVVVFNSNGSSDPDGDPLTFEWRDNQLGDTVISRSASFTRTFDITGNHLITLNVYDGHGILSYNYSQVKIIVDNRSNHLPRLENGTVTPKEGDQNSNFDFSVRYFDEDNEPPYYINLIIDGPKNAPLPMFASDPLDTNFRDGKDYYIVPISALLKGQDYPHNYSFETTDKKASPRVATDTYDGPTVKWVRYIGKDSWMPDIVPGYVYLIGNFRTFLSGVNITPDPPANNLSLGLAFVMNTTAPADKWFWANVTILYNNLNYSQLCESSLKVFWSVDNQPWTAVPNSGLDIERHLLWFNVTRPNAKYAVFGKALPTIVNGPPPEKKTDYTMVFVGAGIAVAAAVGAVVFLMMRKKKAPPTEHAPESPVEESPARTRSGEQAPAEENASEVQSTGGGTVKTFQPGGSGVAIFRPGEGQKTKLFRPGGVDEPTLSTPSTEAEEKIFKPDARDVEDGETAEGPVVQEEAVRERVVEYTDEKTLDDEKTPDMPGARPAEEEIEEVEGKKPIQRPAGPKKNDESLDDLMKELDK